MKCLEKLEPPKKTVKEEDLFKPFKKQVFTPPAKPRVRKEEESEHSSSSYSSSSSEEGFEEEDEEGRPKSEMYSDNTKYLEQTDQNNSMMFATASNFIRYMP